MPVRIREPRWLFVLPLLGLLVCCSLLAQRVTAPTNGSDATSAAIARIYASQHASMPEPKCAPGEGGASLTVKNGTKLPIRYLLKGPTSQEITLEPSLSVRVNLAPGSYQVAAEIPNSKILPFYGEENFSVGTQCQQGFYLSESAAAAGQRGEARAGTPEYTTQSLYLKMAQWSKDAVGYDQHRWQKSRMELLDTVLGSTIKLNRLKLDATELKVGADGTTYSQVYALSELGMKQLTGKCRSSQQYDRMAEGPGTEWPGASPRMMRFDDHLRISLHDDSDRLSLDLSGISRVNIVGRVTDAAVCSPEKMSVKFLHDHLTLHTGAQLAVEIIKWSKAE